MAPPAPVRRALIRGDHGLDVVQFQYGINRRAKQWDLPGFHVAVDGELGLKTERAATYLLFAAGFGGRPMDLAREGTFTLYAQRWLRGTRGRTPAVIARSAKRRPVVRKRRRKQKGLDLPMRERAMREAERLIGVMEQGGNNVGEQVEWIIASGGGRAGDAWCGWFVAHCYKTAGSKAVTWQWGAVRLLYPLLGIRKVTEPLRGDLVRFTFDHVGMFDKAANGSSFYGVEGNTGATGAVSDSRTGGDGVYRKIRSRSLANDYLRVTR